MDAGEKKAFYNFFFWKEPLGYDRSYTDYICFYEDFYSFVFS